MDNQQANPLHIGWIAGIIDGEGWLILNRQLLPSGNFRYVPVVGVNATSQAMIDQIQAICLSWGIGTWVGKRNFKNHWKDQYALNVRGFQRASKLLKIITPHLVVKPKQAVALQKYIDLRIGKDRLEPCGAEEQALYELLKQLNQKGKASTTK